MPNDIYIGSRYVPLPDGEWDSTKSYEALTIVTYGNNSYTSKRPVPVGIAPTDTNYWMLSGNYNGQISNLQQEIDTLANRTGTLENKFNKLPLPRKVLLFGDSYMVGIGGNVNHDVELAIESLTGWEVTTYAEQSLGYIRSNSDGHKCIDLVNDAISSESNPDTITDCVLACSVYNELGMVSTPSFNYEGFYTEIRNCANALINAFPNARITIAPALWCGTQYGWDYIKISRWETLAARNLGLNYSAHSINWLMAYETGVRSSDNIHPNHNGYEIIGANIASLLNGTEPVIYSGYDELTMATGDTLRAFINGNNVELYGQLTKSAGQSFNNLCNLGEWARCWTNVPLKLKKYGALSCADDVSAIILDKYIYCGSDALEEGATYVIRATIPIVEYNP